MENKKVKDLVVVWVGADEKYNINLFIDGNAGSIAIDSITNLEDKPEWDEVIGDMKRSPVEELDIAIRQYSAECPDDVLNLMAKLAEDIYYIPVTINQGRLKYVVLDLKERSIEVKNSEY